MVIKVYVSSQSGNKEVKKRQQRVLMILDSKNIKYDVIDITEPGRDEDKEFMQVNSKSMGATIGDPNPRHPLPPQLFSDTEYCCDYDQFDLANEVDKLEELLKMEPPSAEENGFGTETTEEAKQNGDSNGVDSTQLNGKEESNLNSEEAKVNGEKSRSHSKESSPVVSKEEAKENEDIQDKEDIKDKEEDVKDKPAEDSETASEEIATETKVTESNAEKVEEQEDVVSDHKSESSSAAQSKEPSQEKEMPSKDISPSELLIENEKANADQ